MMSVQRGEKDKSNTLCEPISYPKDHSHQSEAHTANVGQCYRATIDDMTNKSRAFLTDRLPKKMRFHTTRGYIYHHVYKS